MSSMKQIPSFAEKKNRMRLRKSCQELRKFKRVASMEDCRVSLCRLTPTTGGRESCWEYPRPWKTKRRPKLRRVIADKPRGFREVAWNRSSQRPPGGIMASASLFCLSLLSFVIYYNGETGNSEVTFRFTTSSKSETWSGLQKIFCKSLHLHVWSKQAEQNLIKMYSNLQPLEVKYN